MKTYIAIDNGVTGSIAVYNQEYSAVYATPVIKQKNYTKAKGYITRLDFLAMNEIFKLYNDKNVFVLLERPMINNKMFQASISAARCHEATQILIEMHHFPHEFVDSKQWQKEFFPTGKKKAPELKKYSMEYGLRYFPMHKEFIKKRGEADSLLMALWAQRNFL